MRYYTSDALLALLTAGSAVAYSIASGLAAPTQPSCSLYTLYYTDAMDLASGTSSLFSTVQSCTTSSTAIPTTITTTSASPASSTSAAASINYCPPSVSNDFANPGFERSTSTTDPNFGWTVGGTSSAANTFAVLDVSSGSNPYCGKNFLSLNYVYGSASIINISQALRNSDGGSLTVTLWARTPVDGGISSCYFYLHTVGGGYGHFQTNLGTEWRQYSTSLTIQGQDTAEIGMYGCTSSSEMFLDEIHYSHYSIIDIP